MSSGPRSSAENYTFAPEPLRAILDRQGWDGTMVSIATRLLSLEARDASYEAVVDRLKTQALQVVTSSLTTEIEVSRAKLAALQAAYEEIEAGGIDAERIDIDPIGGFSATNVQAAIAELLGRTATVEAIARRRITVASIFLGAS